MPHLPYSHWCIISPVCIVWYCDGHIYTYRRGASALLVSTDKAMRRPQNVKRARVLGFTSFLCINSGMTKPQTNLIQDTTVV